MASWRHVDVDFSASFTLYTELSDKEIAEVLEKADDFLFMRFCTCSDNELMEDANENRDRWTRSRFFPTCQFGCGGFSYHIKKPY